MPQLSAQTLLAALVIASLASGGLLGLWAATSRWHWFARTMVVLGLLTPLLWRPIYEPFVTLLVEVATVALGVTIYRRNWPQWRFNIASVLMLTVVVAVVVAALTQYTRLDAMGWDLGSAVGLGAIAGMAVLLGTWTVVSRKSWIQKLLTLVVSLVALSAAEPAVDYMSAGVSYLGHLRYIQPGGWNGLLPGSLVVLPLWAWGTVVAACVRLVLGDPTRVRWWWPAIAGLMLATYPAYVAWRVSTPLPVPDTSPAASPDFAALMQLARQPSFARIHRLDAAAPVNMKAMATAVAQASGTYEQVDKLLEGDLHIAVHYDNVYTDEVAGRCDIMRVLSYRTLVAHQQMDLQATLNACRASLQYAERLEGQGLFVDAMAHVAIEGTALEDALHTSDRFSSEQRRMLAAQLVKYNQRRAPWEETVRREHIFNERAYGWGGHLYAMLEQWLGEEPVSSPAAWRVRQRGETLTALLATQLAIEAYHQELNVLPAELSDLVPAYLPQVLEDPCSNTGEPFVYRRSGDAYTLYSRGYDGDDDGGQPMSSTTDEGDLRLEDEFGGN